MPFMWGRRWGGLRGDPAQLFPSLPKDAKIRRFWEGSGFGVAVPAQNFPGIIDSIRGMAPGETVGEGLEQLRENVVNRKSDITMSWITVILLAIILFIRFFPR
jgi:hypothetical protein